MAMKACLTAKTEISLFRPIQNVLPLARYHRQFGTLSTSPSGLEEQVVPQTGQWESLSLGVEKKKGMIPNTVPIHEGLHSKSRLTENPFLNLLNISYTEDVLN